MSQTFQKNIQKKAQTDVLKQTSTLKSKALIPTAFCASLMASPYLYAAGFQINEHSAAGLGRANAGQSAIAENASVVASNPALMTDLTSDQSSTASMVATWVDPEVTVDGTMSPTNSDASENDVVPSALIPALYYVTPINDRLSLGIGAFSSFGLKSQYADNFNASEIADTASITTYTINPSIAYRVNDQLSIGLGISYLQAEAELSTSLPNSMGGGDLLALEGGGSDLGWNIGLHWRINDATQLGFSYRSGYDVTLEGDASSDVVAAYNNDGELELNLPDITDLSIAHQLSEHWQVSSSITYTNWERFNKLEADIDGVGTVHIKDENWHGAYRYAIGTSYRLNPTLLLRAGLAYDESPVDAEYRTLSIPDSNRIWYSSGANFILTPQADLDLAYTYIDGEEVDVTESSSIGTTYEGTSEGDAHILSVQMNFRF